MSMKSLFLAILLMSLTSLIVSSHIAARDVDGAGNQTAHLTSSGEVTSALFSNRQLRTMSPGDNFSPDVLDGLDQRLFLPTVTKPLPCASASAPSWNILALIYETTDFTFADGQGSHRFVASITDADKARTERMITRFALEDIPLLSSCNMIPTITFRYVQEPLQNLTSMGCNDYAPSPSNAAPERDPAFDSVITIWDGSGVDMNTGQPMSIQRCAWAWPMGAGQTYATIAVDMVVTYNTNIFKHEWGHSILFYYDAAGTAPKPAVNNHINNTDTRYVNCRTGESYILVDEDYDYPIPNSIYNNHSGFTHDYYSGETATADRPTRCLGITPQAWASGGPVSRPRSAPVPTWRGPEDDVVGEAIPFAPAP